ncbi:MAG: response regulator [Candidatus Omnitrophota bacterium]
MLFYHSDDRREEAKALAAKIIELFVIERHSSEEQSDSDTKVIKGFSKDGRWDADTGSSPLAFLRAKSYELQAEESTASSPVGVGHRFIDKKEIMDLLKITQLEEFNDTDFGIAAKFADEISSLPDVNKIMIVGDSAGYRPLILMPQGYNITFVECSEYKIRELIKLKENFEQTLARSGIERELKLQGINGEFGILDIKKHRLEKGSFDLITLIDLVGRYVRGEPRQWLLKAKKLLKPKAYLIIDERTMTITGETIMDCLRIIFPSCQRLHKPEIVFRGDYKYEDISNIPLISRNGFYFAGNPASSPLAVGEQFRRSSSLINGLDGNGLKGITRKDNEGTQQTSSPIHSRRGRRTDIMSPATSEKLSELGPCALFDKARLYGLVETFKTSLDSVDEHRYMISLYGNILDYFTAYGKTGLFKEAEHLSSLLIQQSDATTLKHVFSQAAFSFEEWNDVLSLLNTQIENSPPNIFLHLQKVLMLDFLLEANYAQYETELSKTSDKIVNINLNFDNEYLRKAWWLTIFLISTRTALEKIRHLKDNKDPGELLALRQAILTAYPPISTDGILMANFAISSELFDIAIFLRHQEEIYSSKECLEAARLFANELLRLPYNLKGLEIRPFIRSLDEELRAVEQLISVQEHSFDTGFSSSPIKVALPLALDSVRSRQSTDRSLPAVDRRPWTVDDKSASPLKSFSSPLKKNIISLFSFILIVMYSGISDFTAGALHSLFRHTNVNILSVTPAFAQKLTASQQPQSRTLFQKAARLNRDIEILEKKLKTLSARENKFLDKIWVINTSDSPGKIRRVLGDELKKFFGKGKNLPLDSLKDELTQAIIEEIRSIDKAKERLQKEKEPWQEKFDDLLIKMTAVLDYKGLIRAMLNHPAVKIIKEKGSDPKYVNIPEHVINAYLAIAFAKVLEMPYYEVPEEIGPSRNYFEDLVNRIYKKHPEDVVMELHVDTSDTQKLMSRMYPASISRDGLRFSKVLKVDNGSIVFEVWPEITSDLLDLPKTSLLEFCDGNRLFRLDGKEFIERFIKAIRLILDYVNDGNIVLVGGHGGLSGKSYYINSVNKHSKGTTDIKLDLVTFKALASSSSPIGHDFRLIKVHNAFFAKAIRSPTILAVILSLFLLFSPYFTYAFETPKPKIVNSQKAPLNLRERVILRCDDGPHPIYTRELLYALEKLKVKNVEFYFIGENMAPSRITKKVKQALDRNVPSIIKKVILELAGEREISDFDPHKSEIISQIIKRGYCLGNHTYTHPDKNSRRPLELNTEYQFLLELIATQQVMNLSLKRIGEPASLWYDFATPGGNYHLTEILKEQLNNLYNPGHPLSAYRLLDIKDLSKIYPSVNYPDLPKGLKPVSWDIDSYDANERHKRLSPLAIRQKIIKILEKQDKVKLLIHPGRGGWAEALEEIFKKACSPDDTASSPVNELFEKQLKELIVCGFLGASLPTKGSPEYEGLRELLAYTDKYFLNDVFRHSKDYHVENLVREVSIFLGKLKAQSDSDTVGLIFYTVIEFFLPYHGLSYIAVKVPWDTESLNGFVKTLKKESDAKEWFEIFYFCQMRGLEKELCEIFKEADKTEALPLKDIKQKLYEAAKAQKNWLEAQRILDGKEGGGVGSSPLAEQRDVILGDRLKKRIVPTDENFEKWIRALKIIAENPEIGQPVGEKHIHLKKRGNVVRVYKFERQEELLYVVTPEKKKIFVLDFVRKSKLHRLVRHKGWIREMQRILDNIGMESSDAGVFRGEESVSGEIGADVLKSFADKNNSSVEFLITEDRRPFVLIPSSLDKVKALLSAKGFGWEEVKIRGVFAITENNRHRGRFGIAKQGLIAFSPHNKNSPEDCKLILELVETLLNDADRMVSFRKAETVSSPIGKVGRPASSRPSLSPVRSEGVPSEVLSLSKGVVDGPLDSRGQFRRSSSPINGLDGNGLQRNSIVYYPAIGGGHYPIDIKSVLSATDCSYLVGSDIVHVIGNPTATFNIFREHMKHAFYDLDIPWREEMCRRISSYVYTARFPYRNKPIRLKMYYKFDATKDFPKELNRGYWGLFIKDDEELPALMDPQVRKTLFGLLDPKVGFLMIKKSSMNTEIAGELKNLSFIKIRIDAGSILHSKNMLFYRRQSVSLPQDSAVRGAGLNPLSEARGSISPMSYAHTASSPLASSSSSVDRLDQIALDLLDKLTFEERRVRYDLIMKSFDRTDQGKMRILEGVKQKMRMVMAALSDQEINAFWIKLEKLILYVHLGNWIEDLINDIQHYLNATNPVWIDELFRRMESLSGLKPPYSSKKDSASSPVGVGRRWIDKKEIMDLLKITQLEEFNDADFGIAAKFADEISVLADVNKIMLVGDSAGYLPLILMAQGYHITFVECSEYKIRELMKLKENFEQTLIRSGIKRGLKLQGINEEFGILDIKKHRLEKGSFDLITLIDLVGRYVRGEPRQWLLKAKKLLKPKAYLIMDERPMTMTGETIMDCLRIVFPSCRRLHKPETVFRGDYKYEDISNIPLISRNGFYFTLNPSLKKVSSPLEKRVLLVDDNPGQVSRYDLQLRGKGYEVLTAQDGEAAFKLYEQNNGDFVFVITDKSMPKMNGIELIKKIRKSRMFESDPALAQQYAHALGGKITVCRKSIPIEDLLKELTASSPLDAPRDSACCSVSKREIKADLGAIKPFLDRVIGLTQSIYELFSSQSSEARLPVNRAAGLLNMPETQSAKGCQLLADENLIQVNKDAQGRVTEIGVSGENKLNLIFFALSFAQIPLNGDDFYDAFRLSKRMIRESLKNLFYNQKKIMSFDENQEDKLDFLARRFMPSKTIRLLQMRIPDEHKVKALQRRLKYLGNDLYAEIGLCYYYYKTSQNKEMRQMIERLSREESLPYYISRFSGVLIEFGLDVGKNILAFLQECANLNPKLNDDANMKSSVQELERLIRSQALAGSPSGFSSSPLGSLYSENNMKNNELRIELAKKYLKENGFITARIYTGILRAHPEIPWVNLTQRRVDLNKLAKTCKEITLERASGGEKIYRLKKLSPASSPLAFSKSQSRKVTKSQGHQVTRNRFDAGEVEKYFNRMAQRGPPISLTFGVIYPVASLSLSAQIPDSLVVPLIAKHFTLNAITAASPVAPEIKTNRDYSGHLLTLIQNTFEEIGLPGAITSLMLWLCERDDAKERFLIVEELARRLKQEGMATVFIEHIVLKIVLKDPLGQIAQGIITAANELTLLVRYLEKIINDRHFVRRVISYFLFTDNIKEKAPVLLYLAGKLNQQMKNGFFITSILEAITPYGNLEDLKERSERLINEASGIDSLIDLLHQYGLSHLKIREMLHTVAPREDIAGTVKKFYNILPEAPRKETMREALENEFKHLKNQEEFLFRIVSVVGGGSATAVYETDTHYLLLTNTHVVENHECVMLMTNETDPKEIGIANVIMRHKEVFFSPLRADLAIIAIEKQDLKVEKLVPLSFASEFKDGDLAVLVSGSKDTVSSGHLIGVQDMVILFGAEDENGDSGSPYLVKTKEGYRIIALEVMHGPAGTKIAPETIKDMANALEGRPSCFKIVSEDSSALESARDFLRALVDEEIIALINKILSDWNDPLRWDKIGHFPGVSILHNNSEFPDYFDCEDYIAQFFGFERRVSVKKIKGDFFEVAQNKRQPSDLVIYFDDDRYVSATHFGMIREDGRVESKFGVNGHVYAHPFRYVPRGYGVPKIFRRRSTTTRPESNGDNPVSSPLANETDQAGQFVSFGRHGASSPVMDEAVRVSFEEYVKQQKWLRYLERSTGKEVGCYKSSLTQNVTVHLFNIGVK